AVLTSWASRARPERGSRPSRTGSRRGSVRAASAWASSRSTRRARSAGAPCSAIASGCRRTSWTPGSSSGASPAAAAMAASIARATRDGIRLLDAYGMEHVIVETVGVGQTELAVMRLADTTVVVLVPEAGDAVQVMKAGLLEIADVFVVNKADREGADRMQSE